MIGKTEIIADSTAKSFLSSYLSQIQFPEECRSMFSAGILPEFAQQAQAVFSDNIDVYTALVNAFACDTDEIKDESLDETMIFNLEDQITDLTDRTALLIQDFLDDAFAKSELVDGFKSLTITDGAGYAYALKYRMADKYLFYVNSLGQLKNILYHENVFWKFNSAIESIQGSAKNYLYNIATDLKDNIDIKQYLSTVAQTAIDLSESVNTKIQAVITDGILSKSEVIKNIASDIRESFASGGVFGVVKYLKHYIEAGANVTTTSYHLTFTDNTIYVPQIFMSGVVQGAITVIGTVATMVAAVFSPVLSVAVSLITNLTSQIVGIFSQAHVESYASINQSTDETVNLFSPYGTDRRTILTATLPDDFKDWWDAIGRCTIKVAVPGGFLLIGQYDTTHTALEFHPSIYSWSSTLIGRLRAIWNLLRGTIEIKCPNAPDASLCAFRSGWRTALPNESWWSDIRDDILELASDISEVVTPNMTGEYAGYFKNNDANLRLDIMRNTMLWRLYTICIEGETRSRAGISSAWLPWSGEISYINTTTETRYGETIQVLNYNLSFNGSYTQAGVIRDTSLIMALYPSGSQAITDNSPLGAYWSTDWYTQGSNTIWSRIYGAGSGNLSWTRLPSCFNDDGSPAMSSSESYSMELLVRNLMGIPTPLITTKTIVNIPKYDWTATLSVFIAIAAASAVTGFIGGKLIHSAKLRLGYKQAVAAARVNDKYQQFVQNPTYDNYIEYRKAVFKANFQAAIIGGTKFSNTDYWFGGTSVHDTGGTLNKVSSAYQLLNNLNVKNQVRTSDDVYNLINNSTNPSISRVEGKVDANEDVSKEVYKKVTGNSYQD